MPTWRTSLGRTLIPGKTPIISQARELQLAIPEVQAIPPRDSIAILPPADLMPVDLALSVPSVLETNFAVFGPPGPVSLLAPANRREDGPGGRGGIRPPLSHAVRLDQTPQETTSLDAPDTWEWILPLVEPPAVASVPAPQLGDNRLRPYQVEGVRQIVLRSSLLLADDLGLGKTVQACTAIYTLVQRGMVHRALVLCSATSLRHWITHLQGWAPGLLSSILRGESDQRRVAWRSPAHVYLTDHVGFVADLESGALAESARSFDLVILDDLAGAQRSGEGLWHGLDQIRAARRLALTGGPPGSDDFWLSVFDFLFPQSEVSDRNVGLMAAKPQPSPVSILRRTKAEVGAQLPLRTRIEFWVDLCGEHLELYRRAIAVERRRLAGLGDAVSPAHIHSAISRLSHAASYGPGSGVGAKVQLLGELLEEIANSGAKALLVVNDREERRNGLVQTLDRFGVVNLDAGESEESRGGEIQRFRSQADVHVLVCGIAEGADLPPISEVSYILHVDPHRSPAVRLRADEQVRPGSVSGPPLHVYEFWSTATIEARLYDFMVDKIRFSGAASNVEAELSLEDWLEQIIEVGKASSTSGVPLQRTSDEVRPSEIIPDMRLVRGMDQAELTQGVTSFIHALGFPNIEQLFGSSQPGVDLLAWREAEGRIERVLVRCMTEEGNVGVADARLALELLAEHPDISRAYLVGIGDFSPAAKKAAEDTGGRLELISGSELARHLRLLGRLAEEPEDRDR